MNQPIIQLTRTEGKTIVNYTPVSATADLQLHGVTVLEKGVSTILIDPATLNQFASTQDLTIIATPGGQTNGVYADLKNGILTIKENNGGTSNVKVSWIIMGKRNVDADYVPDDIKNENFDTKLKDFTGDENLKGAVPTGPAGDGTKLNMVNPK